MLVGILFSMKGFYISSPPAGNPSRFLSDIKISVSLQSRKSPLVSSGLETFSLVFGKYSPSKRLLIKCFQLFSSIMNSR